MTRVVCLLGPTAAGKTAIACALSDLLPCRLISMDSAMVYRGLDIGTAKPDARERARHPHALIDIREPEDVYSAAEFVADADREVRAALDCGRVPVLVGGSMLYAKAFREGLADVPRAAPRLREAIAAEAAERGWPALHAELAAVDPEAAHAIHPNNPQRVQRALEVYRTTARPLSEWWRDGPGRTAAERLGMEPLEVVATVPDRSVLHERIEARLDRMLLAGFEGEVGELRRRPGLERGSPAMRAVGYRQMWAFLEGEIDRATMRARTLAATRQLAKKQLTWLRAWPHVIPLHPAAPWQAAREIARLAGR